MSRKKIKGFILDLDGVITDTAELHYQSWKRMADEEGLCFNREMNEQLRGVSRRKSLELILDGHKETEEKMQELMDRKNDYYKGYIDKLTKDDLLPGAGEFIQQLKAKGYKTAVASASKNARPVIEKLKIKDYFDTISDGYSVEKSKPAPDLFLYTAQQLNLKPEECVVIEDAESGIEAALAANMTAVGIGPVERVGRADYYFQSMRKIKLEEIVK